MKMSGHEIVEIVRLMAVMALVCAAAALTTPKGRVPLALRGVLRILRKDRALSGSSPDEKPRPASVGRRISGALLLLLALALALVRL